MEQPKLGIKIYQQRESSLSREEKPKLRSSKTQLIDFLEELRQLNRSTLKFRGWERMIKSSSTLFDLSLRMSWECLSLELRRWLEMEIGKM